MHREAQLIERITKAVPSVRGRRGGAKARRGLRLGIGDDAAILAAGRRDEWVLSSDALVDGIHFRAKSDPPDSAGYKALARATSDLAAMGAKARFFLLTLALPADRTGTWLDAFLRGMSRAARELGMWLAGGDTTRSDQVSISITVIGEIGRGLAVKRSGARPGDRIYVARTLRGLHLSWMHNAAAKPAACPVTQQTGMSRVISATSKSADMHRPAANTFSTFEGTKEP